jgi:AbrB family looped-hinge helix DNA binding protein
MNTVTLSTKYQLVIPREVRERLELEPGAKLTVIEKGGSSISFRSGRSKKCAGSHVARGARACARRRIGIDPGRLERLDRVSGSPPQGR